MAVSESFSILFHIRKSKKRRDKKVPIYLRITINGVRTEYAIKRYINPNRWNSKGGKAKGSNDETLELNDYIETITHKVKKAHKELIEEEIEITGPNIISRYTKQDEKKHTLVGTFDYYIKEIKKKVGNDYSPATITRYETTLSHIKNFLPEYYSKDDILLKKLNHAFATNLELYFKVTRTCNHNTTMKYIKNVKRVVKFAREQDWLDIDPFFKFKTRIEDVKRDFLTDNEIEVIIDKEVKIPRLELVRDIFIFACYTGLAYIDIKNLSTKDITKGIDGDDWIVVERKKTGTQSRVIILPEAQRIIDKYKDHPLVEGNDTVLPILSNQRMNSYLKEIGDICEIEKELHFHMARHTFATTVTLKNDVPIETVSAMLGHKNIRTTQIYAKVVDKKISNDMNKLKEKFIQRNKTINQEESHG